MRYITSVIPEKYPTNERPSTVLCNMISCTYEENRILSTIIPNQNNIIADILSLMILFKFKHHNFNYDLKDSPTNHTFRYDENWELFVRKFGGFYFYSLSMNPFAVLKKSSYPKNLVNYSCISNCVVFYMITKLDVHNVRHERVL